jgi:hypothetical protein
MKTILSVLLLSIILSCGGKSTVCPPPMIVQAPQRQCPTLLLQELRDQKPKPISVSMDEYNTMAETIVEQKKIIDCYEGK